MNPDILNLLVGSLGTVAVTSVGALVWVVKRNHGNHQTQALSPENPAIVTILHDLSATFSKLDTNMVLHNATLLKLDNTMTLHEAGAALRHQALEKALDRLDRLPRATGQG